MDWKGIWEKVLAGVIGAAILGVASWFWGSWSAPEAPIIVPVYTAIDIPNPIFLERDTKKLADLDAAFRVSGLAKYMSSSSSSLRLGSLKIRNTSRVRSKAIEVSTSSGGLFKLDDKTSGQEFQKQITIPSLDGLKEASFIVISNSQFPWEKVPIQLIYDDRTVDVVRPADVDNPMLLVGGTFAGFFFVGIGLVATIFLVVGVVYSIAAKINPDLEIRNMSNTQVAKILKQIERIKEKFPEKLPKDNTSTAGTAS